MEEIETCMPVMSMPVSSTRSQTSTTIPFSITRSSRSVSLAKSELKSICAQLPSTSSVCLGEAAQNSWQPSARETAVVITIQETNASSGKIAGRHLCINCGADLERQCICTLANLRANLLQRELNVSTTGLQLP